MNKKKFEKYTTGIIKFVTGDILPTPGKTIFECVKDQIEFVYQKGQESGKNLFNEQQQQKLEEYMSENEKKVDDRILIVDIKRIGNHVFVESIYQDKSKINSGDANNKTLIKHNSYFVICSKKNSSSSIEITEKSLVLLDYYNGQKSPKFDCFFSTEEEAIEWVQNIEFLIVLINDGHSGDVEIPEEMNKPIGPTGFPSVAFPNQNNVTTQQQIDQLFDNFKDFLKEKNKRYGDSAMNPINIFSKVDSGSQICNRLDDKLSRIKNSPELKKNDLSDVFGYVALLLIQNGWTDFDDLLD